MFFWLFLCLFVPGGSLEPHKGVFVFCLDSSDLLPLKRNERQVTSVLAQQPALKAHLFHKNGTLGARGFFLSRQDLHRGFALTIEALLRQKNPMAPRLQKWCNLTKIASW